MLYLQQIGEAPRVPWKNLTIQNSARPKALFNLWLLLQERLPTKDMLIKWNLTVDGTCVMCQQTEETRNHLFLDCTFATQLRYHTLQWIGATQPAGQNWPQFVHWFIDQAKGKSPRAHIFKMTLAEMFYVLWLERNARIFGNTFCTSDKLLRSIAYTCNVRAPPRVRVHLQHYLL